MEKEELERPKIKDYFPKGTNLKEIIRVYDLNPELFNYTKALDNFIDRLKSELDGTEIELTEQLAHRDSARDELQALKAAVNKMSNTSDNYKWGKYLDKVKWKQHSHMAFETYYLNTEVGEIRGETIYKNTRVNRTGGGYRVGKSKVTYSKTLESKDLTEQAVIDMMNLAKKQLK